MAKDFFEDIGELGVLGDILGGMVSGLAGSGLVPKNSPDGRLFTAQSEMFKLKKQEAELLLEVGRQAYKQNPTAFPQNEKLKLIHANMAEAQVEIDEANREKEQSSQEESPVSGRTESNTNKEDAREAYIRAASEFDTPDTRICKKCETRIRDPKVTECFYCGESLNVNEKTEKTGERGSMNKNFTGKYYMVMFEMPEGTGEEEHQQALQMLEAMAESADTNTWELNTVEFFDDTRTNVKLMFDGSVSECTYTIEENKIKVVDAEGDEIMRLFAAGDTLVHEKEGFGKLIFSKTPPAQKK